jgi:hypothetical protein
MLRIGYLLLSKYKELFKAPVLSFTSSYSQKDGPFEHSPKEDRVYDLLGPHTRDVRSESDHGCHLMEEL